ncbi:MAG: 2OG-Fe(II) oxygenase [Pseudoxanthomonas sp.]
MPALPLIDGPDPARIADALAVAGACRVAGFPDAAATAALRADLLRLREAGILREAAVGHGRDKAQRRDIRGDSTLWLDDDACGDAARGFLAQLDALRTGLNRELFLGATEVEAHYACYPPGAFYRRHRDRFRDDDVRVVSVVGYLNDDWTEGDGGALRLYLPDGEKIDVPPQAGASVVFRSELEHEVLPATRQRLSIAAWMRRRA